MQRLAPLFFGTLATLVGARASAGEVDLVLSCPVGANPPSSPSNPQATPCPPGGVCGCRVYWANQGEELTGVVFSLIGERLRSVDLADPTLDPDGNTSALLQVQLPTTYGHERWAGWIPEGGATLERNILATFRGPSSVNGYVYSANHTVASPYGDAAVDVSLPVMPAGQTGQFDIEVIRPLSVGIESEVADLTLVVAADQPVDFEPQVAPLRTYEVASPGITLSLTAHTGLAGGGAVRGSATVSRSGQSFHSNVEIWTYLPYWNGSAVVADELYDPLLGHELVVDVPALVASATTRCEVSSGVGCATLDRTDVLVIADQPDHAAPDAPPNANRRIRLLPGTNRLVARVGLVTWGTQAWLDWSAPLAAGYSHLAASGGVVPGRSCARSEDVGVPLCGDRAFRFVTLPPFGLGYIQRFHWSRHRDGTYFGEARNEGSPIRANRWVQGEIHFLLQEFAALGPLEDVELVFQVLGSDAGPFGDTTVGRDVSLDQLRIISARAGWRAPHEIHVSTAAGDYGDEADLPARTLPAAGDPSWRLCASSAGDTMAACDDAGLAAHGITLADVTHVRLRFPRMEHPMGNVALGYRGLAAPTARVSIDGSAASTTDMRRASMGMVGRVSFRVAGTTQAVTLGDAIELDTRPRVEVAARAAAALSSTLSTTGWYQVCGIWNLGESNLYTPITLDFDLPPGFVIAEPLATNLVVESVTVGSGWSQSIVYDPVARRLSAIVTQPGPVAGYDATVTGPVPPYRFDLWVRGAFGPGAPEVGLGVCRVRATYDDINGARQEFDQTRTTTFTLTNVFPVLRVSATADRALIERHGQVTIALAVEDEVFDDATGQPLPSGARAGADEVALTYRVPREGDAPVVEQGHIAAALVGATSVEASAIVVSVLESPTMGAGPALVPANGWLACATPPAACDGAALAVAGVADPAAVRWVGFRFPRVEMTDAAPRSPHPGPGLGHVDVPYVGHVTLRDRGSVGEPAGVYPSLVTFAEVRSLDTATPAIGEAVVVQIDEGCDASLPGVGFELPEVCDGHDNDCDGAVDEDLVRAVTCDDACVEAATETCDETGAWVGGCADVTLPSCAGAPMFGVANGPGGPKSFRCDRASDGSVSCLTDGAGRLALFDEVVCR